MGAYERQSLTVEVIPVDSPTVTPVDAVTIVFSSAISGFDEGDLELSLNGGENRLTERFRPCLPLVEGSAMEDGAEDLGRNGAPVHEGVRDSAFDE